MVSFVCGNCQDVIKKNKVNSHCINNCPDAWEFTCVDCSKTFEGFDYQTHNQCITEKEKYWGQFTNEKSQKVYDTMNTEVKKTEESKGSNKEAVIDKTGEPNEWLQIINVILKEKGQLEWKKLRDIVVKKYCRKRKISSITKAKRSKLNWECLASIPISYTSKSHNMITYQC
ncbi:uncharacterized protein CMU_013290 [Cryptosporidium muris RN66]|uniref:Zinc finger C2H2 LYAR-type domain-containing protein n=1 Tax=Cryptosporidium muris (strain RN66) TaxID=441375 RepID=B6AEN7_CRYMR|nr:uncharacterized protein CMU_013290 [Cryptosporidium muris RN66]EEA06654.1 hypothetical protein, conserved [Cryptosporidium muris RN66]|eukprot:XP_002141003.1 hypothetical protein [Cryptosporidium muris RN66]